MRETRYGIFLRPDPATCWAVTQVTLAVARQFGFVAGAVFPPHATLIGNLNLTPSVIDPPKGNAMDGGPEEATLIGTVGEVFAETHPFVVHNQGVRVGGRRSIRYDVDHDAAGTTRNSRLLEVAERVKAAVQPLHVPHGDYLAPNVGDYTFRGHLSLASFDLEVRPNTFDEVLEFITGLPVRPPASFTARWFSLFRFDGNWNDHWWNTMTFDHVASWTVQP